MGLNLFTALGAFELYTGIYVLQNFPTWGWLLFLIIGMLLAPYSSYKKQKATIDDLTQKLKSKNQITKVKIMEPMVLHPKRYDRK